MHLGERGLAEGCVGSVRGSGGRFRQRSDALLQGQQRFVDVRTYSGGEIYPYAVRTGRELDPPRHTYLARCYFPMLADQGGLQGAPSSRVAASSAIVSDARSEPARSTIVTNAPAVAGSSIWYMMVPE
jgi:hypothetical protein